MNSTKLQRYEELLGVKMRLDKFFSMYLDKYGDKMDSDKVDTPIWKLYKTKLKEYDDVSKEIKELEYWLSKTEEKVNQKKLEEVLALKEEAVAVEQEKQSKASGEVEAPKFDAVALAKEGLKAAKADGYSLEEMFPDNSGFIAVREDGSRAGFAYSTGVEVVEPLKPLTDE